MHRIAVLDAAQPVLGPVLRLDDPAVDELEECGSRIAVVFAQASQEPVHLAQVENVQRAPGLRGADVEPALTLTEVREEVA